MDQYQQDRLLYAEGALVTMTLRTGDDPSSPEVRRCLDEIELAKAGRISEAVDSFYALCSRKKLTHEEAQGWLDNRYGPISSPPKSLR